MATSQRQKLPKANKGIEYSNGAYIKDTKIAHLALGYAVGIVAGYLIAVTQ